MKTKEQLIQSLEIEVSEVIDKLTKALAFLRKEELSMPEDTVLTDEEYGLLTEQVDVLTKYRDILFLRIGHAKSKMD